MLFSRHIDRKSNVWTGKMKSWADTILRCRGFRCSGLRLPLAHDAATKVSKYTFYLYLCVLLCCWSLQGHLRTPSCCTIHLPFVCHCFVHVSGSEVTRILLSLGQWRHSDFLVPVCAQTWQVDKETIIPQLPPNQYARLAVFPRCFPFLT